MTTETKRDLHADLAICSAATSGPWNIDGENNVDGPDTGYGEVRVATLGDTARTEQSDNARFIAEARIGWPRAIERAIAAERWLMALVEALERGDIAQTRLSSGTDYVIYCARKAVGR